MQAQLLSNCILAHVLGLSDVVVVGDLLVGERVKGEVVAVYYVDGVRVVVVRVVTGTVEYLAEGLRGGEVQLVRDDGVPVPVVDSGVEEVPVAHVNVVQVPVARVDFSVKHPARRQNVEHNPVGSTDEEVPSEVSGRLA